MNPRYAVSEIRKHGGDLTWWRKRFLSRVVSFYFTSLNRPASEPLVERDWDNVILLDACRYDLFKEVLALNSLPGSLEKRHSVQSGTPGYLAENFADAKFHDVVYVTANPYVNTELPDDTFHTVESVWKDGWDEDENTVLPDVVAERALSITEEYPDKRLIVHFDQPHAPFVGKKRLGNRNVSAIRQEALGNDRPDPKDRTKTPFDMLATGEATTEQVWTAYRSNLELAFPEVDRLLNSLSGKTAVTSDHGNALGEFAWPFPVRVYGHPLGVLIPALTEVPWHTYQNGDRKRTIEEPPECVGTDDDARTEERLRALGYAE